MIRLHSRIIDIAMILVRRRLSRGPPIEIFKNSEELWLAANEVEDAKEVTGILVSP